MQEVVGKYNTIQREMSLTERHKKKESEEQTIIQDIAPHCYHNEFQDRKAQPEDLALVFRDRETLLREGEEISFFTLGEAGRKKGRDPGEGGISVLD